MERSGEDGPFRFLGRTSVDILESGGDDLSALEIEGTLREHPAVSEIAVVGWPGPAWGDRVVTWTETDEADLRAFVKERLAPYKVPKQVHFVSELPKNALDKVIKPEILRRLAQNSRG